MPLEKFNHGLLGGCGSIERSERVHQIWIRRGRQAPECAADVPSLALPDTAVDYVDVTRLKA